MLGTVVPPEEPPATETLPRREEGGKRLKSGVQPRKEERNRPPTI